MKEFKCRFLESGNSCQHEGRPCCYYCENIVQCMRQWRGHNRFCIKLGVARWCSDVQSFIREYGYYTDKETVMFT